MGKGYTVEKWVVDGKCFVGNVRKLATMFGITIGRSQLRSCAARLSRRLNFERCFATDLNLIRTKIPGLVAPRSKDPVYMKLARSILLWARRSRDTARVRHVETRVIYTRLNVYRRFNIVCILCHGEETISIWKADKSDFEMSNDAAYKGIWIMLHYHPNISSPLPIFVAKLRTRHPFIKLNVLMLPSFRLIRFQACGYRLWRKLFHPLYCSKQFPLFLFFFFSPLFK